MIPIWNLPVYFYSKEELLQELIQRPVSSRKFPTPIMDLDYKDVCKWEKRPAVTNLAQKVPYIFPTGGRLHFFSSHVSQHIPATYSTLELGLAMLASRKIRTRRIYLFSSNEKKAKRFAEQMEENHPNVRVMGYAGEPRTKRDLSKAVKEINQSQIDMVCFGLSRKVERHLMSVLPPRLKPCLMIGLQQDLDYLTRGELPYPEVLADSSSRWIKEGVRRPGTIRKLFGLWYVPLHYAYSYWKYQQLR